MEFLELHLSVLQLVEIDWIRARWMKNYWKQAGIKLHQILLNLMGQWIAFPLKQGQGGKGSKMKAGEKPSEKGGSWKQLE